MGVKVTVEVTVSVGVGGRVFVGEGSKKLVDEGTGVLEGARVSVTDKPEPGYGVQVVAMRTGVLVAEGKTSKDGMVGGGNGFNPL